MTLRFYAEHPDQALNALTLDEAIERLRNYTKAYLSNRNIGAGRAANLMHPIVKRWAHPLYQSYVSKSFSEINLRDFIRATRTSNLIEPARLLVHAFIWVSDEEYRRDWGMFDPMSDESTPPTPPTLPAAPGAYQNLSS